MPYHNCCKVEPRKARDPTILIENLTTVAVPCDSCVTICDRPTCGDQKILINCPIKNETKKLTSVCVKIVVVKIAEIVICETERHVLDSYHSARPWFQTLNSHKFLQMISSCNWHNYFDFDENFIYIYIYIFNICTCIEIVSHI